MNEKNSDNTEKKLSRLDVMRKLFYFGLGVKRWILTGVIGISISSIGFVKLALILALALLSTSCSCASASGRAV